MSDDKHIPTDAELEALLDEESDQDFGQPEFDETTRAVLKEWSAQDFANIYTRFRPHLERHARRFLRNQSQVDEVVQDAFLYLMVTLPELDSELGVLRFLKWKTRLLCLDVIRVSSRAQLSDIDAHPEFESNDPEVSASLEQAEDAAIVRLALSKLNPRHREVLIASMYEEKTSAQIAAQVGLTENATNQLIFRARASFKRALLGDDIDTTGMSTAKILSVAARKAAAEAKKMGAQAMVFALFLILAVGAFVTFNRNGDQGQVVAEAPTPNASNTALPSSSATPTPVESTSPTATPTKTAGPAKPGKPLSSPAPEASVSPFPESALDAIYEAAPEDAELFSYANAKQDIAVRQDYAVANNDGMLAEFAFASDSELPFKGVKFTLEIAGMQYFVYPDSSEFYVVTDPQALDHYIYFGSMAYVFDENGKVWSQSELAESTVRLELVVNPRLGKITDSFLMVLPADQSK